MFIAKAKFEQHMLKCPRVKNRKEQEGNDWFNKGVNLNNDGEKKLMAAYNSVTGIDPEMLLVVIGKVVRLFRKCYGEESNDYIKSTEEEKIKDLTNDHTQAYLLAEAACKANLIKEDIIYI